MMHMFKSTGQCPTIYGPVSSRRHGLSLGVNLGVEEKKICTWRCVYCQCGMGERRDFQPKDVLPSRKMVLKLLEDEVLKNLEIKTVTFAGNCEPSSHPEFSEIINDVIALRVKHGLRWKVTVLTNGSELDRPEVVSTFDQVDEAWVKIDCGVEDLFQRLNKPMDSVGSVEHHVQRIKKLKKIYIQTLLWDCPSMESLSNFTTINTRSLIDFYKMLQPQMIHITTIQREPAVKILKPVSFEELNQFKENVLREGLKAEVFF